MKGIRTIGNLITAAVIVAMVAVSYPRAQALFDDIAMRVTGKLLISATAPTISGGFGSGAAMLTNNGAAAFRINVGTGATAWSGTVGLPTAANQWNCQFTVSNGGEYAKQTDSGSTTTRVTVWNWGTGLTTTAWQPSDVIIGSCFAS